MGDRDHRNARPREFAEIHFAEILIAKEARHRMHQHGVEGPIGAGGGVDHPLELGPAVIGGGCARLDEAGNDICSFLSRPGFRLGDLIRN
nr:hypothetical protein [Acidiphilium sp.]